MENQNTFHLESKRRRLSSSSANLMFDPNFHFPSPPMSPLRPSNRPRTSSFEHHPFIDGADLNRVYPRMPTPSPIASPLGPSRSPSPAIDPDAFINSIFNPDGLDELYAREIPSSPSSRFIWPPSPFFPSEESQEPPSSSDDAILAAIRRIEQFNARVSAASVESDSSSVQDSWQWLLDIWNSLSEFTTPSPDPPSFSAGSSRLPNDSIHLSGFPLNIYEHGVIIKKPVGPRSPFVKTSPSPWIRQQINIWETNNVIHKVPKRPKYVMPLYTVPKPGSNKLRLIYDARYYNNQHGKPPKISCPKPSQIIQICYDKKLRFAAKIDISDAFLTVKLSPSSNFLGFSIDGQFYVFDRLPFGLTQSPFILTSVLRPIVNQCKSETSHAFAFYDDILIAATTEDRLSSIISKLTQLLNDFGWNVNLKKSILEPQQSITFIGLKLDLQNYFVHQTSERVRLAIKLVKLISKPITPDFAREVLGLLSFVSLTNLPLKPLVRSLFNQLNLSSKPLVKLKIPEAFISTLSRNPPLRPFDWNNFEIFYTDATPNQVAYLSCKNKEAFIKSFNSEKNIFVREAFAILTAIANASSNSVLIFADNQAANSAVLKNSSSSVEVNSLISKYLTSTLITPKQVKIKYIRSEKNPADWFSRLPVSKGTSLVFGKDEVKSLRKLPFMAMPRKLRKFFQE